MRQAVHEALRGILSHWPSAATANSSKEVLLLHEIEMLTEHADQSALQRLILRKSRG